MHAFSFLQRHLSWLERAYANAPLENLTEADEAGWAKLWATAEMVMAAERSVRRGVNRVEHCIYGPGKRCPDDLPFNCACCSGEIARSREAKGAAA